VQTVRPQRKTLHRVVEQPAWIEAYEETALVPRIAGYVQKVFVDIGDPIRGPELDNTRKTTKEGQVLAELWVPEMEEEFRQKQALVNQAEAEKEQAIANLSAADANVATAQALVQEAEAARSRTKANYDRWESEYNRMTGLVQRKVIDQQSLDETRHQFKAAESAQQEVEAKVRSTKAAALESQARRAKAAADIAAAKSHIQVAQAEAGRTLALLQYAKIRAPYNGIVTRRTVSTGDFLQPGTGSMARPLFVVARSDVVRVVVEVPENDAVLMANGTPAQIRVPAIKEQDYHGSITRSSWSLDSKARTLRTEIDLDNPQGKLRPGMYAVVIINAAMPGRLTVPPSAVLTESEQAFCFLAVDGKAMRVPVKLGAREPNAVEILKKQTRAKSPAEQTSWEDLTGEEVFVNGHLSDMVDGKAVKAIPEKASK
jgi:multidrug resistance efflux pump